MLHPTGAPGFAIAIARDPVLDGVFADFSGVTGWRLVDLLFLGEYRWLGGLGDDVTLFVDPTLAPSPPAERRVTLHLRLTEPEEESAGCAGGSSSSCADIDFTMLQLELGLGGGSAEAPTIYLLELVAGSGETRRELLVAPSFGGGEAEILVFDRRGDMPSFKSVGYCVALTPVGDDAELGLRMDLGCVRPDGDDPRVSDDRGCAGGGARLDPWLWLLALVLAPRRSRRIFPALGTNVDPGCQRGP